MPFDARFCRVIHSQRKGCDCVSSWCMKLLGLMVVGVALRGPVALGSMDIGLMSLALVDFALVSLVLVGLGRMSFGLGVRSVDRRCRWEKHAT